MKVTSWRRRRDSPADGLPGRRAHCGRRQGHRSNAGSAPAAPAPGGRPAPPRAARATATTRPPAMPGYGRAGRRGSGHTRSPAGPPARTACGNRRPPASRRISSASRAASVSRRCEACMRNGCRDGIGIDLAVRGECSSNAGRQDWLGRRRDRELSRSRAGTVGDVGSHSAGAKTRLAGTPDTRQRAPRAGGLVIRCTP